MIEFAKQPFNPDAPVATEANLSSLGVVDPWINSVRCDFKIVKFAIGAEIDPRQIACQFSSWRGKMVLGTIYNKAFYEDHFVRQSLDEVFAILLVELEINRKSEVGNS